MKLDFAILAHGVDAHDGLFFIHRGGLRQLAVPAIPVAVPVGIAVRLMADLDELGSKHNVRLKVLAPEEAEPLFISPVTDFELNMEPTEGDSELFVVLAFNIGSLPLTTLGTYVFEFELDDQVVSALPLRVRLET